MTTARLTTGELASLRALLPVAHRAGSRVWLVTYGPTDRRLVLAASPSAVWSAHRDAVSAQVLTPQSVPQALATWFAGLTATPTKVSVVTPHKGVKSYTLVVPKPIG